MLHFPPRNPHFLHVRSEVDRAVDLGFRTENILLFEIDPTRTGEKGEAITALYYRIRDEVQALPGVSSVSWSNMRPLSGALMMGTLHLVGSEEALDPVAGMVTSGKVVQ